MTRTARVPDDGIIFLFPGQGNDPAGALAPLFDGTDKALQSARAEARLALDEIAQAAVDCEYGAAGAIHQVLLGNIASDQLPYGMSQLAQFAASVALARFLVCAGIAPHLIVGVSLGEVAALVCAGAFTVAEATRLVCALNDAYRTVVGQGALVLIDASEEETRNLLARTDRNDLVVACLNAPRQMIVSGPTDAIAALMALDEPSTPRRRRLPIPYPGHHPALQDVYAHFLRSVGHLTQQQLRVTTLSPVRRRVYTDDDDLLKALADTVTQPVHLTEALHRLAPPRQRRFIEVGVGSSLSHSILATIPNARAVTPLASGHTWSNLMLGLAQLHQPT
ncbi:acyltransferase domain-containing protein [Streptomyces sp. TRM66268-LWL]|uniref:[acyl-carrier-protein] S-malonyltransferase n=1 Tax=Streptomyces polyasparticus TaxID=2767826 RepID=A0ABR7SVX2_9ACTN|nr:acyltransferase domain-containing protein [Streptomyces polyasparticus]MBC9719641.1 acyltransferase domain-containing protein [Streptomyces polyasparticus]